MKSTIKIGRDKSNDIEINEPRISRNHAIITNLGNDTFDLKDLGSTNGTFVNGVKIVQQIITPEDRVEVAGFIVDWYAAFLSPQNSQQLLSIQENAFTKILKTISIGSATDNDIVVSNDFVSGHHANISLLKNGNYFIQDLASTNGTFVNGARVSSKNFTRTDIVKIAYTDLPMEWFRHKNLKASIFRDHKKTWLFSVLFLFILTGTGLYYFYSCKWFDFGCTLTPQQIYMQKKSSLVHIIHDYYYKIDFQGRTYYVGKNKLFKGTEANPSKENLLPYNSIEGSGCFIRSDGTILTSVYIVNPWLNESEKSIMLNEVINSKSIEHFSLNQDFNVCGATAELKWLADGLVNNPQNYIAASSIISCILPDSNYVTIQSVKKYLPETASYIKYSYDTIVNQSLKKRSDFYYSYTNAMLPNAILQDTFYSAKDSFDVKSFAAPFYNKSLPKLTEGSVILNDRGELIGIIEQNKIEFINNNNK